MILDQIKVDQLALRKAKGDPIKIALLTTLIGEASAIGKNDGDRATTDTEVISIVKKFVKGVNENIDRVGLTSMFVTELETLQQYLPKQLTDIQLGHIIQAIVDTNNITTIKQMGVVAKQLKQYYDGQYDGAIAAKIIKEKLGA